MNQPAHLKTERRRPRALPGLAATGLLVALALCSGCNFAPNYKTPSVPMPAAFKETNDWKEAAPRDDALKGKWWEAFGDPQLNAYEDQVCLSNQNIAAGFANFMSARAIVREAQSQFFPTASTSPSVVRSHEGTSVASSSSSTSASSTGTVVTASRGVTGTTFSLPFDASWEPDLWGTVRNTVKADRYNAQASVATLENLRLTAQADLAVDYYELRGQDALNQVFEDTVKAYRDLLKLTTALFKAGIDSEEDVAAAQTQLATTEAQATNLGIQRAQYEHAIALLLGQPASTFSIPVQPFKANAPPIPPGLPSQLLERRPDIAVAERAVAAANAQIGVARAAFFPTLTLSASGGYNSTSLGSLISGPSAFWSLGASLAQPLFDGGLRIATVNQYHAQYDSTVANYRQTVLTAFQQVEDNLASLRILSLERKQQDAAVKAAQHYFDLATNRYHLGIDSYLNVITAQTSLLSNQQTAVNLQTQQMTASIQLILALGGGWDVSELPPPRKINSKDARDKQKPAAN